MAQNGGRIDFQVGLKTDQSSFNQLKSSLQGLSKIKIADFNGTNQDLKSVRNTANQVQRALQKAFNVNLNSVNVKSFTDELSKAGLSVDKIYSQFSKAGAQGQVAFSQMASSVLTTNLQLKETNSLIDSMGKTMVNTVKWGIASSVMNTFTQSVQSAFSYIQSLEKSLTDIRIVTGDSQQRMEQFAISANKAAAALGRSTMDYTKSSLTFFQQGLDAESVAARTEAVLKAQNITGTGSQMADYLTSVWNGYKVANEQAQLYVDKLAAVADSSASDMSQLAIAMSKVASTANVMGVDVDQLNAQLATVVATTRMAPESVGTAFKTIYARLNDIKAGADEAEISLGNYSTKMASLGFNVLDASGKLRDTGQVMQEIGGRWQDLTRQQQVYLAQTMGGQRQITQVMALFDNWDTYVKLLNTSLESQGTLMEKNSRYMESLGAKMEQLGAAGERVKNALVNEQDLKGLVDFGTNAVNLFATLIQSIGGGSNAILAFGSTIAQVFSGSISRQINNIVTNIQNARNNQQLLNKDVQQTRLYGQSQGYKDGAIDRMIEAKKAAQEYYKFMDAAQINEYNNIVKEIGQTQDQVTLLQQKIDKANKYNEIIQKTVAGTKQDPIDQLYEEIVPRAQALKETLGGLTGTGANQVSKDFNLFSDITQQVVELKQVIGDGFLDDQYTEFEKLAEVINQAFGQGEEAVAEANDEIKRFIELANTISNTASQNNEFAISQQQNEQAIKKVNAQLELLIQKQRDYLKSIVQYSNVKIFTEMTAGIGQVVSGFNSLINITKVWQNENLSAGQKMIQTLTNLSFTLPSIVNGFTKVGKGLDLIKQKLIIAAAAQRGLTEEQIAAALASKTLTASFKQQAIAAWASLGPYALIVAALAAIGVAAYALYKDWNKEADAAKKASQVASNAKRHYEQLNEAYNNLKKSLEDYNAAQDAIDSMTKGTQEWKEAIQESNDAVLELINNYPKLAQYVQSVNGRLMISEQGQEEVLQQANNLANVAKNASSLAGIQSRNAGARATAAGIAHESGYTITNESGDQAWRMATSDQVIKVTKQLNEQLENIDLGSLDNGIVDLSDTIAKETGLNEELVKSILSNDQSVNNLRVQLEQNEQANKLVYQALTSQYLQGNAQYQGFDEEGKRVAQTIGGQILENTTRVIQDQIIKLGKEGVAIWSGSANEHLQEILQRYNKATGKNAYFDSNAVTGTDTNRVLQLVQNGQIQKYRLEEIASIIAAKQALDSLGNVTQETTKVLNNLSNFSNKSTGQGILSFIGNGDLNNLTKNELENLDLQSHQSLDFYRRYANQLGYSSEQELYRALVQAQKQALANFDNVIKQAGGGIKQTLKEFLNGSDFSLQTSQNIQKSLDAAFDQAGKKGLNTLVDLFKNSEITDTLSQTIANADIYTPQGLKQLEETLKNIGEEQLLASKEWQNFKGTLENTYFENPLNKIFDQKGQIASITKDLKNYSVISPQDYQTLLNINSEISKFFQITADGYTFLGQKGSLIKLLTGGTDGYLQIAGQYETIKKQANQLASKFSEDFQASLLSGPDLGEKVFNTSNFIGNNETLWAALGFNKDSLNQVLDEYNQMIRSKMSDSDWTKEEEDQLLKLQTELQQFLDLSATAPQMFDQMTDSIKQAAALGAQSLSELNHMLYGKDQEQRITGEQYAVALEKVSDTEMSNLGFDVDEYEAYVDLLQSTNQALEENQYLARQVAKANMRISEGVNDLVDNWDDWNQCILDYLESGEDIAVLASNWDQLRQAIANTFDMDEQAVDMLGPNFVAQNWDKIQAVKDGVEGAYEQLQDIMSQQLIVKAVGVTDFSQLDQGIQDAYKAIEDLNNDATIQVGAVIDNENILAAFQQIADAAHWTSEQAQAAFSQMGYDVEVQSTDAKKDTDVENTQYYVPPHYTNTTLPYNLTPFGLGAGEISFPVVDYGGHYVSAGGGVKQNYEPSHYAIKTVTKNGAGFGGNISRRAAGAAAPRTTSTPKSSGRTSTPRTSTPKTPTIKTKEPSKIDPIKDTQDRYHDINLQIQDIDNRLEQVQEQQKKLSGGDLINNLNKQLDILNDQIAAYETKLELQHQETDELRNALAAEGALFDDNTGALTNYSTLLSKQLASLNSVINTYNSMSAESQATYKDVVDQAKEDYEQLKKNIDRYDELISSEMPQLRQSIRATMDKQIQLQVEKFKMRVELELDLSQAERDFNQFRKKVIDKIRKDDVLGNTNYLVADLSSYYKQGLDVIDSLTDQINGTLDNLADMDYGGLGSVYGDDRAKAIQDLKNYTDQLIENLEDVQQIIDDVKQSFFDMVDAAQDAFDQQTKEYDYLTDLINHDKKLIELLYGEEAYDKIDNYYKHQQEADQKELDFQKQQKQFWWNQMQAEKARMEGLDKQSNQYKEVEQKFKELEQHWLDSVKDFNNQVEKTIQNLLDTYQNNISIIFKDLGDKLTNGQGLDYINEEWQLINDNADRYLDKVNSMYEIEKLQSAYEDAIRDSDGNLKAQQSLNNLMNQQLKMLKDKDRLTQYDVDRANLLLQLQIKRLALQQAQQNKSKLRLRRDSQGNYTYQYTADNEQMEDAQQSLADVQNQLYNLDRNQYRNNLNDIYSLQTDFNNKMQQLYEEYPVWTEEAEQKRKLLVQQYGDAINNLTDQNQQIRLNLMDSAFDSLADLYDTDVDNFKQMSRAQQDELMNNLIPQWNSGLQNMADAIAGPGGFIDACQDAFDDLTNNTEEYGNTLDELELIANADFESMAEGIDENIYRTWELLDNNDELIDSYYDEFDAIQRVIDQVELLTQTYANAKAQALGATEAAYNYWRQEQQKNIQASIAEKMYGGVGGASVSGSNGSGSTSNGSVLSGSSFRNANSAGSGGGRSNATPGSDIIRGIAAAIWIDGNASGWGNGSDRHNRIAQKFNESTANAVQAYINGHAANGDIFNEWWPKRNQLGKYYYSSFDTGGYTGQWGRNGKLGILHEKELILDENDTSNILNAVAIVRTMDNLLSSITPNIGLSNSLSGFNRNTGNSLLDQNVHITANFPGVNSRVEIEDAFSNLINRASQYAFRKNV